MTQPHNVSPSGIYAFAECDVVDVQDNVLLLDRHSDAQLLVTRPLAESMQNLGAFRTLEAHTDWLTSSYQELAGQHADVMNVLGSLRDQGLLVTAESACEKLNGQVAKNTQFRYWFMGGFGVICFVMGMFGIKIFGG